MLTLQLPLLFINLENTTQGLVPNRPYQQLVLCSEVFKRYLRILDCCLAQVDFTFITSVKAIIY